MEGWSLREVFRVRFTAGRLALFLARGVPQGLKPNVLYGTYGTTEVVPLRTSTSSQSRSSGCYAVFGETKEILFCGLLCAAQTWLRPRRLAA